MHVTRNRRAKVAKYQAVKMHAHVLDKNCREKAQKPKVVMVPVASQSLRRALIVTYIIRCSLQKTAFGDLWLL